MRSEIPDSCFHVQCTFIVEILEGNVGDLNHEEIKQGKGKEERGKEREKERRVKGGRKEGGHTAIHIQE